MEAHSTLALTEAEAQHLQRMLRGERRFSIFMVVNLLVAAILASYYTWAGSWNGPRAVLVLLILMGARAHLRLFRSAQVLRKYNQIHFREHFGNVSGASR